MAFDGYSLAEILTWSGGQLANQSALGSKAERLRILRMVPLEGARPSELAFLFSKKYQDEAKTALPGVLITADAFVGPIEKSGHPVWKEGAVIACTDPYFAMAVLSEKFASVQSTVAHHPGAASGKRHPTAVIDPTAEVSPTAAIGAHSVIEAGARIGDGCVIYPGCYVGPGVELGAETVLFPRVTLYERVKLGRRVRVHAGAVIGADGFGYAPKTENGKLVNHQKIFHLGRVVIGDEVEIGANTCIDRGTLKDTVIGPRCKLDDHVMIGHNSELGEGVVVCGCVAMAGSTEVGDFVYIGGLSGIPNGTKIGKGAKLGGGSFILGDVAPGEAVGGHPHRGFKDFLRLQVILTRLLKEGTRKK